ncbi:Hcp family type VI secretion system effector [Oryzobacter terrae]|uniref:Hcp family type VI secretion system effector n=1 Tax=Oryzobacter terrae TaxID=1620385 RepID=UPI0036703405
MAIFARIGSIRGESVDARHQDEIEVLSWTWGVSQSGAGAGGTGSGGGAGRATVHDLRFTHRLDRASPLLMKACATGEHLRDATMTVRRAGPGQLEFLVVTMSDVRVTSVSSSVSAEGDSTLESVDLAFARVDLEYRPQKPNGTLDAGVHFAYDLKKNKAG